jgi:hypothetical protein
MLANPPIVPSKDALRVLRQLAFAGSTLAAITVVTVNYNVHRRIKMAEQLLETKRQIRAASTATGQSRVARLIEAAENGEDFTIQAMQEQKIKETRYTPSQTRPSCSRFSKEQASDRSSMLQNEGKSYLARQHTTNKIKKATMAMISTAPAHIYGRPGRLRTPTPFWPKVGKTEGRTVENLSLPPTNGKMGASGEEAAEKIKRATLSMISSAPAHAYGRPTRSLPKARPNLHDPVASWLDTRSNPETTTDTAPVVLDLSRTSEEEKLPVQSNASASSAMKILEDGVRDGTDQYDLNAAQNEISCTNLNPTGTLHETDTIFEQHREDQRTSCSVQVLPNDDVDYATPNESDHGLHLEPSTQDTSLVELAWDSQPAAKSSSGLNDIPLEFCTADQEPSLSTTSHTSPGRVEPPVVSNEHEPERVHIGRTRTPVDDREAEQQVFRKVLSADSRDRGRPEPHNFDEAHLSTASRRSYSQSEVWVSGAPSTRQPYHDISLEPKPNKDDKSTFTSWPYLQLLEEYPILWESELDEPSRNAAMAGEHRPSFLQKHAVEISATGDEKQQLRHEWTPFPRPARVPEVPELDDDDRALTQDLMPGDASQPIDAQKRSEYLHKNLKTSREDPSTQHIMTAEQNVSLAFHIRSVFATDGFMEGRRAWRAVANQRLKNGDFAALDFLYGEIIEAGLLSISPRHHLVQSLVQWHYKNSKYSARAAEILFPDPLPDSNNFADSSHGGPDSHLSHSKEDRKYNLPAIRFLQGLWDLKAESDWLMLNFRRIIVAAKLRGVKLVEELFAVVVRCLASVGDMSTAQAVYDEMIYYHQIRASFLSRTLLLRGYARINDWYRAEREIESLHAGGLSRTRPHGYALMIDAVLREYAARTSVEQFQGFLINAISYWGLVPTSSISATTIQTYLSHRRYDLVREWMETLQVLFPQIETETSSFQWQLGKSWQLKGADCEDIEQTIKALAYRNPRTKLKTNSVPMIHEALSRDLSTKLDAARTDRETAQRSYGSPNTEDNGFSATKTLDDYLSSAFSLAASAVSGNQTPPSEIVELHRQATAVQRVNEFLSGTSSSEVVNEFSFPETQSPPKGANDGINRDRATLSLGS